MDSNERREKILNILKQSKKPIKGIGLAAEFKVSRQVIVQDIAILRAKGDNIIATPQGYIIPDSVKTDTIVKTIVCKHSGGEEMEDELNTIVDMGGKVIDVIVEHPIYGEIKGLLLISSRLDVKNFMKNVKQSNAEPLSLLTEGIHIHSIEVKNEDSFKNIVNALKEKKYLINF
ncbi:MULTISPECIES: transcription repressor NadR [Tissierellales]|jgi:hypothetical protein|uniref:Transcription repressor NadR n=1 Tax=Acidilutibacter cellobiosedens TaxID=2507161 RepID=A0A410Q809_9FIRM|nr:MULTISPECIES: transcription repressor NadR [Tissierellales]MBE6083058.1 transcription repressor NadR [Tissierellaceae bacterium]QAT60103.1 transcription repressor NadR [Acidilutibacter cellobiosedens]SCL92416.1 putative transcription repressor NiaR [Sporanaerobacter sp. PP17-6a]